MLNGFIAKANRDNTTNRFTPSIYNFSSLQTSSLVFYGTIPFAYVIPAVVGAIVKNDWSSAVTVGATFLLFAGLTVLSIWLWLRNKSFKIINRHYRDFIIPIECFYNGMSAVDKKRYRKYLLHAYELASELETITSENSEETYTTLNETRELFYLRLDKTQRWHRENLAEEIRNELSVFKTLNDDPMMKEV